MSYEGYVQHICAKGHRFDLDVYDYEKNCPTCGAGSSFANHVDETNCESYGIIPPRCWEHLLIAPEVVEVCNLNHPHVINPARYRPPTDEEYPLLRGYWDGANTLPLKPESPFFKDS